MFKITEGVLAILMLAGLDEPPDTDRFSIDTTNSYFAEGGVDVSLVWIGADLQARMMQQHRDNLETPGQVTVDRINKVDLGPSPVTEVVYYKSRPVADLKNPGEIIQGHEATWQYIWPGDDARSFALLTIWRSGAEEIAALESGFDGMRDRWQAGAALPGTLYDMRSERQGDQLILTGVSVEAPVFSWGRVTVPVFHDYGDWAVVLDAPDVSTVAVSEPILLEVPGLSDAEGLQQEIGVVDAWVAAWSPVFEDIAAHLDTAGATFAVAVAQGSGAADLSGGVALSDMVVEEETRQLEIHFVSERPDGGTHEGWVRLDRQGQVTGTEVFR